MKLYAIREVSELTGIKPVTLRAWQRRYGLIQPQRTKTGHRLYTEENINTIKLIQSWLVKGVAIGKVKALIEGELKVSDTIELLLNDEVEQVLTAISVLNKAKAEHVIGTVFREYPMEIVLAQFFYPIMEALERVKVSQRSLQTGLFRSIMVSYLSGIVEAENRFRKNQRALLISLDGVGSLPAWICAVELGEKGYSVTLLDGVEDTSGLSEMVDETKWDLIYFFSNRTLQAKTIDNIIKIKQEFFTMVDYSKMVDTLHSSIKSR